MIPRYKIWTDSESVVEIPLHIEQYYTELETACDVACSMAHEYDGELYRAIFHVEDLLHDETIETYENLLKE